MRLAFIAVFLSGCSREAAPISDTGARQCVQDFCKSLIQQDWAKGYASLDSQSQRLCTQQQFGQLARSYLRGLGFEPEAVHVRLCEERGAEATGHVVLTGQANDQKRRHKDAFLMRQSGNGWGVMLPTSWAAE